MEIIYIHLLSEFDTVYKFIENQNPLVSISTTESLNSTVDLELTNPSNFDIAIYPITKKMDTLFSYSAKFRYNNNKLTSENNYVKIYKLPENHFFIKFSPFSIPKQDFSADKIELNESKIKKLSFLNDLAGRAKVEVLKVEDKKINKENEYFVYLSDNVEIESNSDLILIAFFEAYITSDFNTCFSYLSQNYAANLSKEGLKEFFGDISSCLLVNYYSFPAVILFYDNHSSVFSSNIKDGKIFDIYEIN